MFIIYYKNMKSQDQKLKQPHFVEEQEVRHTLEQQSHNMVKRKTRVSSVSMCLLEHW